MLDIHLGPLHLQAWPQRALYWPAQKSLLVADLHLGKADTFRQFGIAVPQQVQRSDLQRLSDVLTAVRPQRCLILGDLVHGRIVGAETATAWNALLHTHPATRFELIAGNHDRAYQPDLLHLHAVHKELQLAQVWLSHEPVPEPALHIPGSLNIHGHIHSAIRLEGSHRKLPALVYQPPYLSLPAFSEFTAGVTPKGACQGIWVFASDASSVLRMR